MSFTEQLIKLLPQGGAWPRATVTNLYRTIDLFRAGYDRILGWADYGLRDTFPVTAADSVETWQKSVSLPDPLCPPLTPAQLKQQMIARVMNLGGQSVPYFVNYASQIGYNITIVELSVPRAGLARAGQASNGDGGDHVWCVHVADATESRFRAGGNRAGENLTLWSNIEWLRYEFNRIKPSHSIIEWFAG